MKRNGKIKKCKLCGEPMYVVKSRTNTQKFCSIKCYRSYLKDNPNNYWKNKKRPPFTKKWREKISRTMKRKHRNGELSIANAGENYWALEKYRRENDLSKGKLKTLRCMTCRKIIKKYDSQMNQYHFCSPECYHAGLSSVIWKDSDFIKKQMKSRNIRPSKPELELIKLFNKNDIPFDYTGDGSFFIDGKCPDFKHNSKKKVIEFNGFYTHTPEEEEQRRRLFNNHGFEVMFLHYDDLNNKNMTVEKIREFGEGDGTQNKV